MRRLLTFFATAALTCAGSMYWLNDGDIEATKDEVLLTATETAVDDVIPAVKAGLDAASTRVNEAMTD